MGLDTVEFRMAIEEEFSIEIDDQDAEKLSIVGDIARYVQTKTSNRVSFEQALSSIITMLVKYFRVPRQNINSQSHIIKDLGLD